MNTPDQNNLRTKGRFEYEPDIQLDNVSIEVKYKPTGFRNLRSSLVDLASRIFDKPNETGMLVLVEPRFTQSRLSEEWHLTKRTFHPDVSERLYLVVVVNKHYDGLPEHLGDEFRKKLEAFINEDSYGTQPYRASHDNGQRRSRSFYDVFKVVLNLWLLGKGPVTTKWIIGATGFSYPTVAKSLSLLDHCLRRHRNRKVDLKYFPKEEWARLIYGSSEFEKTIRLADRSGQPRSPEMHLKRLMQLNIENIAIGGVYGAKHYNPNLDIIGAPRLDFSIQSKITGYDYSFIKRLDPALKEVSDPLYPANVVVHITPHADQLFWTDYGGFTWADPVQCLLDLHDANLELQAKELREYLIARLARDL
jgi:hypothetical protein